MSENTAPQGIDTAALYRWLGRQAEMSLADYVEEAANLDVSAGTIYQADAFVQVRARMRKYDPSLPYERIDHEARA